MIETERQRQAAVSWIQYWKASISTGEQSWLGQEQAQESIMALHEQVDAYDKRERRRDADSPCGDTQTFARGEAVDVLLVDEIAALVEAEPAVAPSHVTRSQTSIMEGVDS